MSEDCSELVVADVELVEDGSDLLEVSGSELAEDGSGLVSGSVRVLYTTSELYEPELELSVDSVKCILVSETGGTEQVVLQDIDGGTEQVVLQDIDSGTEQDMDGGTEQVILQDIDELDENQTLLNPEQLEELTDIRDIEAGGVNSFVLIYSFGLTWYRNKVVLIINIFNRPLLNSLLSRV